MDPYKLIKSLAQFIFEIASWPIVIPRTLALVIFRPNRISLYIYGEFDRLQEDRFQDRMSPPLLWVIVSLYFSFIAAGMFGTTNEDRSLVLDFLPGLSIEANVFALALFWGLAPMSFAAAIQLIRRKPLTRAGLEPEFYAQCYLFAAVELFASGISLFHKAIPQEIALIFGLRLPQEKSWVTGPGGKVMLLVCVVLAGFWWPVAQCLHLAHVFSDYSRRERVLRVGGAYLLGLLLYMMLLTVWLWAGQAVVDVVNSNAT